MMVNVWAIGMMRDEADVAYQVLEHLVGEEVTGILVVDNCSTDGTLAVLHQAQEKLGQEVKGGRAAVRIEVGADLEQGYYQSDKMTALAARAAEMGAEWVIPFDADELWYAPDKIGVSLSQLTHHFVVEATMFDHVPTSLDDDLDEDPFTRMGYRRVEAGHLPKVAFRWREDVVIQQGNHSVIYTEGLEPWQGDPFRFLEIRHFPYRSFEQFLRKVRNGAAAYAATDLPVTHGAHWRQYGQILDRYGEEGLRDVWTRYRWSLSPSDDGLAFDPAPISRWETR